MRINVHAGHNPAGMTACGAVGLINESTENRKVKNEVIRLLKMRNDTVYDCTVDNGKNQSDVLWYMVVFCFGLCYNPIGNLKTHALVALCVVPKGSVTRGKCGGQTTGGAL